MSAVRNRIEVMHGVNLDQLGRRDPLHYGDLTLDALEVRIGSMAGELGLDTRFFHTNHEGEFVERLHRHSTDHQHAAIEAGLRRVEERLDSLVEHRHLASEVRRLDERLGHVEKRLDDLVASHQRDALQAELQKLRARVNVVEAQVGARQKPQP